MMNNTKQSVNRVILQISAGVFVEDNEDRLLELIYKEEDEIQKQHRLKQEIWRELHGSIR